MSCYLTHGLKKQRNESINKYEDDFKKKKNIRYKLDKMYKTHIMQEGGIRKYYSEVAGKLLIKDEYE